MSRKLVGVLREDAVYLSIQARLYCPCEIHVCITFKRCRPQVVAGCPQRRCEGRNVLWIGKIVLRAVEHICRAGDPLRLVWDAVVGDEFT